MSRSYDLVVCIRCHKYRDLILDTIDAVKWSTDKRSTKLMIAVDRANQGLAKHLERKLPGAVHCSGSHWGWGPGLYGLLVESIIFASKRWRFSHFVSIDYDTLFIKKGADVALLEQIIDPDVGLIGHYGPRSQHWSQAFERDKLKIRKAFGEIPKTYHPGEGVQGGCMLLTRSFIERLHAKGMLASPYAAAKNITQLADDHLITLFCRMCGLEIQPINEHMHVRWELDCNPFDLAKRDVYIFHPTKIKPNKSGQSIEKDVRNFYRSRRGQGQLV